MRRREFITLLGGAAAAWPIAARAQQGDRLRRIGILMAYRPSDPEMSGPRAGVATGASKIGMDDRRETSSSTNVGRQTIWN